MNKRSDYGAVEERRVEFEEGVGGRDDRHCKCSCGSQTSLNILSQRLYVCVN